MKRHRSSYQQGKVSKGTGDDAGHQIGDRFGARGDKQNLTQQNWIANRGQGTFYALEKDWEELLLKGNKVKVKVTDVFDAGAVRPKYRKVEWIVVAPDGFNKTSHKLDFMNTHTEKSRAATGWTNPFPPGHQAKVIPIDRGK
ncbi:MAG: DNA/RNA non-specific endonuclease [Gemmataceae bacterium]